MTLRLNSFRFYVRLWICLLPLAAFLAAGSVRFVLLSKVLAPHGYNFSFYFAVLLFTTLIWAVASKHYRLYDLEELLLECTGLKKTVSACAATYTTLLCLLFFYRQENFSRVFLALSKQRQVIVLHQDRIPKPQPVRSSAAKVHRPFVEQSPRRLPRPDHGSSRIAPPCTRGELVRRRGNAAQTLQKIQHHPFAGQDDARIMAQHCYLISTADLGAVENFLV